VTLAIKQLIDVCSVRRRPPFERVLNLLEADGVIIVGEVGNAAAGHVSTREQEEVTMVLAKRAVDAVGVIEQVVDKEPHHDPVLKVIDRHVVLKGERQQHPLLLHHGHEVVADAKVCRIFLGVHEDLLVDVVVGVELQHKVAESFSKPQPRTLDDVCLSFNHLLSAFFGARALILVFAYVAPQENIFVAHVAVRSFPAHEQPERVRKLRAAVSVV